jgi:hypothetical protein
VRHYIDVPESRTVLTQDLSVVLNENDWDSIEQEIDANTNFYWPCREDQLYQNETFTRVFVQVRLI